MSIIATVYIKEGIVMAADSRITGTTSHDDGTTDRYTLSDNAQKVFLIKNDKIGISACGDVEIDGKTVADFIRLFELNEVNEKDTVTDIAEKLKNASIGKYKNSVIFHVCGYINDVRYVYKIINDKVVTILDDKNQNKCNTTWDGQRQVLLNLLTGQNGSIMNWEFMQLKDGIDFAEFMIDVTNKIHRFQQGVGTCGGAVDLLLITKDYSKWIRHKVLNP